MSLYCCCRVFVLFVMYVFLLLSFIFIFRPFCTNLLLFLITCVPVCISLFDPSSPSFSRSPLVDTALMMLFVGLLSFYSLCLFFLCFLLCFLCFFLSLSSVMCVRSGFCFFCPCYVGAYSCFSDF